MAACFLLLTACQVFFSPSPLPPSETPVLVTGASSSTPVSISTIKPSQPVQPAGATRVPSTLPPETGQATKTPVPGTPADTPTVTKTPTITRTPTRTPWVYVTFTRAPTYTPTITYTPTPPQAAARILRPGPFSKIISPLLVESGITPGEDGLVLLDLIGEDGRFIARQRLNFSDYIGKSIGIAPKIEFTIPGVAESARLLVSSEDRYHRLIALASQELVLFSIGENQIYPAGYQGAPYILRAPVADQVIQGGTLLIRGLARPVNTNPLTLALLDEQGKVLASTQIQVAIPGGDQTHAPFEIEIPYAVTAKVNARLQVYQNSANRIPGMISLWSVPILLQP